jgi:hypothetical protein
MLSYELRDEILRYVEANVTLEKLEEWLVPRLHTLLIDPNSPDSDLVAAIELGLAEINDGIRTENEFRELLLDALRDHTTSSAAFTTAQTESDAVNSDTKVIPAVRWSASQPLSSTTGVADQTYLDARLPRHSEFMMVVVNQ